MLMAMSINYDLVEHFLANNHPLLIPLLLVRQPAYNMGTGIYVRGYGDLGLTFIGQSNVMMAPGVARKTFLIHFTCYAKAVVFSALCVHHNQNILCVGYEGGNNHLFWNPMMIDHVLDYKSGSRARDILVLALGPGEDVTRSRIDITGKTDPGMGPGDGSGLEGEELHYSTAEFWSKVWGFGPHSGDRQSALFSPPYDPDSPREGNTLAFQDHQWVYGTSASRDEHQTVLGRPIIAKGHWGPNIYPGVGKTRVRDYSMPIKEMEYGRTR